MRYIHKVSWKNFHRLRIQAVHSNRDIFSLITVSAIP